MNGPKQGCREGKLPRLSFKPCAQGRQPQGSQHDAKEHERYRDVQEQVDDVISRNVCSAQRIVHSQG